MTPTTAAAAIVEVRVLDAFIAFLLGHAHDRQSGWQNRWPDCQLRTIYMEWTIAARRLDTKGDVGQARSQNAIVHIALHKLMSACKHAHLKGIRNYKSTIYNVFILHKWICCV